MDEKQKYQSLAQKICEGIPFDKAFKELEIPAEQEIQARDAVLKILQNRQTDELLLHELAVDGIRTSVLALKKIITDGPRSALEVNRGDDDNDPESPDNRRSLFLKERDTDYLAAKALFDGSVKLKSLVRGSVAPIPENAQKDIFELSAEKISVRGPWALKEPGV